MNKHYVGETIGTLKILEIVHTVSEFGRNFTKYKFECSECHKTFIAGIRSTKYGCKACREAIIPNDRLRRIYAGMKNRCYYPNSSNYQFWGERGIRICDEWLNNPHKFYLWAISNGYQENLTIDRIDNDKNYEPSNCRWVTMEEQRKNKRKRKPFEVN